MQCWSNAQVGVVEKVGGKGGQDHQLAQTAVETQHQSTLD